MVTLEAIAHVQLLSLAHSSHLKLVMICAGQLGLALQLKVILVGFADHGVNFMLFVHVGDSDWKVWESKCGRISGV